MNINLTEMIENQLTAIWDYHGRQKFLHLYENSIWHSGILGPETYRPSQPIWATRLAWRKNNYDAQAKYDAEFSRELVYRTEFIPLRNLHLADFKKHSLLSFSRTHCNFSHDRMTRVLALWCIKNKLDGIVNVNGGEGEVVIAKPFEMLCVKSHFLL